MEILVLLRAFSLAVFLKRAMKGQNNPFPVQLIVTACVIAFGGSSFLSMAMGKPMSWFLNPLNPIIYSLICLKVFYFPGDLIFGVVEATACIFCPLLCFVDCAFDGVVIARAINTLLDTYGTKCNFITLVIAGVLASSGGSTIANLFTLKQSSGWKIQIPSQFQSPLEHFRRPLLVSFAYAFLLAREGISRSIATGMAIVLSVGFCVVVSTFEYLSRGGKSSSCCPAFSCGKKETIKQIEHDSSTNSLDSPSRNLRPGTPTRRRLRTRGLPVE